jgi:hypothetical protein
MNSCALALGGGGLGHHRHDPCDDGVGGGPVDANPQHPSAVEGAGEHLVAGLLGDREGFTGDRSLIHVTGTGHDLPVGADPLTGAHHDHVPDGQRCRVHHCLVPGFGGHGGTLGGQIEQAAHRVGGALGQERFQRTGSGEDDDQ